MTDSRYPQSGQDPSNAREVRGRGNTAPDTAGRSNSDAGFDKVPPDATEKGDGGPHRKRQDSSQVVVPNRFEGRRGKPERIRASREIAYMAEPRRLTKDDLDERRIIYPESRDRNLVNRFRQLRTQLLEVSEGENFSLVVTGATQGAGSTFVSINLAAAFAFDQSKTALLIDCNLRYPNLHTLLDIMPDAGLTDFIDDPDCDLSRIIYPTGIPRLRLIPAGSRRESPSEFFTSWRMEEFIHLVRQRYPDRFIILDTSSIAESPDARILTELCDFAMVVVPHGRVTNSQIENAVGGIDPNKFVGAVLNS